MPNRARWPAWIALAALIVTAGPACARRTPDVQTAHAETVPAERAAGEKVPAEKAPAEAEAPPPGIDLSKLDDFERKVFFRIVKKEASACGKAHSLLVSVRTDPTCRASFYAVRYVARLVDAGFTDSEIGESLQKRFRGGPPKALDVGRSPSKGPMGARVTLVEFVDYECPHCKRIQPVIRQLLAEYGQDLRVVFKHYPLSSHTNARLAAEAAVAAHQQAKFWPYSDKLWENADNLVPAVLEKLAGEVGLDVDRWRKDRESPEVKATVDADRAEGQRLGLQATPTIYLNGREFTDSRDVDSLRDWLDAELGR